MELTVMTALDARERAFGDHWKESSKDLIMQDRTNSASGTTLPQYVGGPYNARTQPPIFSAYSSPNLAIQHLLAAHQGYNGGSPALDGLTQAISGMNVGKQVPVYSYGATGPYLAAQPSYYQLPNGRILQSTGIITDNPTTALQHGQSASTSSLTPATTTAWTATGAFSTDLPDLGNRRYSSSSNEETGPKTPYVPPLAQSIELAKVVGTDYSPQAWSTPSPIQLGSAFLPQQLQKGSDGLYYAANFDALCRMDPPIPEPVPAIFSGEKGRGTLETSLQNKLNTTNVYVRGLRPDTTDEMLHAYGARFGKIVSAKSMLDQQTGACKGFGFIKYHNFTDGENCIRGFFYWGYEAKWARVSHNEKLKALGDECNTNLYVSNLPLDFNEFSLTTVFEGYKVLSSKILRDQNGMSRGVGFARFDDPDTCRDIIEKFHGKPIGGKDNLLSVRFADTPDQKKLKAETAEKRGFKTNEYNVAVYGTPSPFPMSPALSNYPTPPQSRVGNTGCWQSHNSVSPLYNTYPVVSPSYLSSTVSHAVPIKAPGIENVQPLGRYSNRIKVEASDDHENETKVESPSAVALAKRTTNNPSLTPGKGAYVGNGHITDSHPSPAKSTMSSVGTVSPTKRSGGRGHKLTT